MIYTQISQITEEPWRTMLTIDSYLLELARRLSRLSGTPAFVRQGLKALIERSSARRLARLGGSEPALEQVPRRQQ
jgi:hypothetical protein